MSSMNEMTDHPHRTNAKRRISIALAIPLVLVSVTAQAQHASRIGQPSRKLEVFAGRAALPLISPDGAALPILVTEGAPPHTKAAAVTLADCIERIGGVRPKILETLPDPVPARAIWVGHQPAMDAAFPGMDFTFRHPEEIVLAANENHVAITGRDRWDPKHLVFDDGRKTIQGKQLEYGTANAVFTFLQERIGVRWLYPGKLGTDYPGADSLRIAPFTYRYHPQFRARSGVFAQLNRGKKEDDGQIWVKHQRLLLDSLYLEGGHPLKDWWEKYHETKPELFALQPDGTRGTFPKDPESKKLCEGEPAVWQTWLKEMEQRFTEYPYWQTLPTVANDGYYSGHCTDPRSRAWDPNPSESKLLIEVQWADGRSEKWPPLSDRYANFANKLSELAKARFPDRDYFILMNAYGEVGNPAPLKTKLRDDVLVMAVHNFHMRHPAERDPKMQQFAEWAKLAKQIVWRPNLGNQAGLAWGFPDVPLQQTMKDFRFVADRGTIGLFFDMYYENRANLSPYYYLVGQLAWNPQADGNAILEDFYQRSYGPAAPAMKRYWTLLEKTRQHFVDSIESRFRVARIHEHYTDNVLAQAESILVEAEKLVAADPKHAARVHFTRCGFIYARALVSQRSLMARFEAGKSKDKELEQRIRNQWAELRKTVSTFPEWAVFFKRMESAKRAAGLHPDAPISKKMLRDSAGLDLN